MFGHSCVGCSCVGCSCVVALLQPEQLQQSKKSNAGTQLLSCSRHQSIGSQIGNSGILILLVEMYGTAKDS